MRLPTSGQLHPLLEAGDLLIGDRAFCSYVHLAMLSAGNVFGLFRISKSRGSTSAEDAGTAARAGPRAGLSASSVRWINWSNGSSRKQKPKWMSRKQFAALPSDLIVREIRYHLMARGQRTRVVTIVTTLLDEKLYPAEKIAELYGLRWQVETHFSELKTGMKMSRLKCKTAEGVKKELLMYFITYNLIRRIILQAAEQQRVSVRRISFIDALRWLVSAADNDDLILLVVVPLRPGRHEPRVKKYLKYRYRSMTRPRHIMKKRPYLYADKANPDYSAASAHRRASLWFNVFYQEELNRAGRPRMSSQSAEQLSFDFLPHLPVVVQRSAGQMSSDAGLLPLRQFDQRWKYTARMADCLHDPKPNREQTLDSMLRQRLFGILAGYEDCNDHARTPDRCLECGTVPAKSDFIPNCTSTR